MNSRFVGQSLDQADWGARAVYWLKQRFVNWPIKKVAEYLDEPESVVKSWWYLGTKPSREKLEKLHNRFAREGFTSFVTGVPCREEVNERLATLNRNLSELRAMLNEENQKLDRDRPDRDWGMVRKSRA